MIPCEKPQGMVVTPLWHSGKQNKTETRWENHRGREINKKITEMRRLYHSEYTGIPAYLMDFGFGGFLGYGKGVPVGLVNEELKKG